jgi:hypothetical protein
MVIINRAVDMAKKEYEYRETYKHKRKQAQIFISNKENRDLIFRRDGKICKHC